MKPERVVLKMDNLLFIFIYGMFNDILSTSDEVCTDSEYWNAR